MDVRREGKIDCVRKGYTCIKSCPPLMAEGDMSLVIWHFSLEQRPGVHYGYTYTQTLTGRHTADRAWRSPLVPDGID